MALHCVPGPGWLPFIPPTHSSVHGSFREALHVRRWPRPWAFGGGLTTSVSVTDVINLQEHPLASVERNMSLIWSQVMMWNRLCTPAGLYPTHPSKGTAPPPALAASVSLLCILPLVHVCLPRVGSGPLPGQGPWVGPWCHA